MEADRFENSEEKTDEVLQNKKKQKANKWVFQDFIIHSYIIYTITNNYHNWYYIGYSINGEDRKETHSSKLEAGKSDIKELQVDYNDLKNRNLIVEEYIKFDVKKTLYICGHYSSDFIDKISREFYDMEQEMISNAFRLGHNLYNIRGDNYSAKTKDQNPKPKAKTAGVPCIIDGKPFDSIKQAADELEKSTGYIQDRLDEPEKYPNFKYDYEKRKEKKKAKKARPLYYMNEYFGRISALKKQKGLHYDDIKAMADDENNDEIKWASEDERIPAKFNPTSCIVFNKKCESLNEAIQYLKTRGIHTSIRKLKEMCSDDTYTDYKYN